MCLSPGFLQNGNPTLIFIQLAEQGLFVLVDWDPVIHYDLFDFSIDSEQHLIDAILVVD